MAMVEQQKSEAFATGGCQCGGIRFEVRIEDDEAYLCHCRMCQRAVGHVSGASKQVRVDDVQWPGRQPDRYRSSPFARHGFCRLCGTSLTYEGDGEEHLDLTIGSFDDPGCFRPVRQYGTESRHAAWLDTRDLPAMRTDENPNIAAKWKNLGREP